MPPKRGAVTPKRGSARLSRNEIKSTPKIINQKKNSKTTAVKSPAKSKETSKPVTSKSPANKKISSTKQSTCEVQEKIKVTSNFF